MSISSNRILNYNEQYSSGPDTTINGFTRLIYDKGTTNNQNTQNMGPINYQLDFNYAENNTKCLYNNQNWTRQNPHIVNAESELKNITRIASKDPAKQYNSNCVTSAN